MENRVRYLAPPISSIKALATALDCDPTRLQYIASHISDYYTDFQIPKKSGGVREIRAPKPVLKTLQRRINSRIFSHCQFPPYLQGSIRDDSSPRDFVSNAGIHSKSKTVIAADIENFYPSVRTGAIKEVFKYLFRFPDEVADILVSLTALEDSLPQGAPTSSYLANLVFFDVEHKVVEEFSRSKLKYTRLIDDITVSSDKVLDKNKKQWIVNKVRQMLASKKLNLHRGKLKLSTTNTFGAQVFITGLWIDRGHPRMSAAERNTIRGLVYRTKKDSLANGRTSSIFHEAHNSVSGKVALMSRLGHPQAIDLRRTLNEHQPEYSSDTAKKLERICYKFYAKKGLGKDTVAYTKRFHRLMYYLSILGRTDKRRSGKLRQLLKTYPPVHRVSQFIDG